MTFCISIAFKFFLKEKMLAARAVGTDRANHPARFASLAALVKRGLFGALNGFALNQRPGFGRDREGAASVAKEAQLHRAFARPAIRARIVNRGPTRGVVPGNSPFVVVGAVDNRSPRFQIVHFSQARQHPFGCLLYTSPSPRDGLLSR